MALREYLIGEVVENYADGQMTRREAMRQLGLLALSASAAAALLAACGTSGESASAPTATGGTGATTAGAKAEIVSFKGQSGELKAAWAAAPTPKGAVLVIHENKGLTPHFHDLVKRFAAVGYSALCVDLVSKEGGTEALGDTVGKALMEASDERLLGDLRAGIDELQSRVPGEKIGAVGFCFGGGMTWDLLNAGEARLAAAVPFYGRTPENPDFSKAKAAVLSMYGGLDERINAMKPAADAALRKVQPPLIFDSKIFQGAKHAFFNDTNPNNYNKQAAGEAWTVLLAWFEKYLA